MIIYYFHKCPEASCVISSCDESNGDKFSEVYMVYANGVHYASENSSPLFSSHEEIKHASGYL